MTPEGLAGRSTEAITLRLRQHARASRSGGPAARRGAHRGRASSRRGPGDRSEAFLAAWAEERERQFREKVPQFREVDLAERLVRVFARLRGMAPPRRTARGTRRGRRAVRTPDEVDCGVDAYSRAFVDGLPPAAGRRTAARAARRAVPPWRSFRTGRWRHDRSLRRGARVERRLRGRGVSQRVGTIKPHPAIFAAARAALGDPAPRRSSTSATTGRRTSSAPSGPAGGPGVPRAAQVHRLPLQRTPTIASARTSSCDLVIDRLDERASPHSRAEPGARVGAAPPRPVHSAPMEVT